MSKRRLSQQQRHRIAQRQSNHNRNLGIRGLVVSHYGKEVDIAPLSDNTSGNNNVDLNSISRCHFRANLATLVCGDVVRYTPASGDEQAGVVESIEPRATLIERPRPYQPPKPVAANIDTIVLVASVEPPPIASLLDRYLVAAENAQLNTVLLFNKYDQYSALDSDDATKREVEGLIELYTALGYPCYLGSASNGQLIDCRKRDEALALTDLFNKQRSVLVGQSGVGKSSIINAITPSANVQVGDVSEATTKGKHTTTTATIYFIDTNKPSIEHGSIIDSPGIREFGLWHLSKEQIIDGMPEFRELSTQCKFRDCDHVQSAGCAIQKALIENQIAPSRHASYLQIIASLEEDA